MKVSVVYFSLVVPVVRQKKVFAIGKRNLGLSRAFNT